MRDYPTQTEVTFDPEVESLLGSQVPDAAIAGDAYEGASQFDKTLALWSPPLNSADADLLPNKDLLESRARDMFRNDAYVQGGAAIKKDSVVGAAYVLNAKPMSRVLGPQFDEAWEVEFQEEVETRFGLWAEGPDAWPDAARRNSLTEMVRLAVGVTSTSGEMLATVEWLRDAGRAFHTAVQFVDIDRLSNPENVPDSAQVRGGVKINRFGAPLGYYIRVEHPSDWYLNGLNLSRPDRWKYVPARKPWGRRQVIHLFEQNRPDQSRGVAGMVSALKEMRITKKFRDVALQNAVVNATYAASIESELPPAEALASIGGGDDIQTGLAKYSQAYLEQIAGYAGNARNLHMGGVKIPHLYPGTKLNLHSPGNGGPLGTEFEQSLLRYIAAALNVSYEQLSRDYSQTSYASARASLAETAKHMRVQKKLVADRFAGIVYRLWIEEAVNRGMIDSLPREAKASGWTLEGQNLDALSNATWIGASAGQIDPLKETQAAILRLKYNLSTDEEECARFGLDWRNVKRQRSRENRFDKELGLTQEQDNRMMNAVTGAPREKSI